MEKASRTRKTIALEEMDIVEEKGGLKCAPYKKVKKSRKHQEQTLEFVPTVIPEIPEIPQILLTVQQMNKDPVQLLLKLEQQYQQFGAVKLVTPQEWNSPFCFKSSDKGITTRIQHLYKLRYGKAFKQKQEAYNFGSFRDFAKDFEKNYRFKFPKNDGTLQEQQQNEYWQLIRGKYQGPEWKFKVTTQYAADLPVRKYGSGFPLSQSKKSKDENFDYYNSLFNLNNIYKSPLSILKIADDRKEYISGVTTPWVYMGMMFSTFCWHVQDLWLNSLNYSHSGAAKTWYVVPKKYKQKFDKFVAQKTGKSDLLNRITFMLDPLQLIKNGIKVYKTRQRPGQYICTFFKAYHAGFSHGFNVGEAVNFASPKSFSYISQAVKSSIENRNNSPFVLSYEWLAYENMRSKDPFKKFNNIVQQEYQKILKAQIIFLESATKKCKIVDAKQIGNECKYDKNSCSTCKNYQYLSSLKCVICNKNYCSKDFLICCNGEYQLIFRQLNKDREKIINFIGNKRWKKKF